MVVTDTRGTSTTTVSSTMQPTGKWVTTSQGDVTVYHTMTVDPWPVPEEKEPDFLSPRVDWDPPPVRVRPTVAVCIRPLVVRRAPVSRSGWLPSWERKRKRGK